jgi:hypothetical protein
MVTCALASADKRRVAQVIGRHLVTVYEKRRHDSPAIVHASMRRNEPPALRDCWALSLCTSPDDFKSHHQTIGEVCGYASMHGEMPGAIDTGSTFDFLSFDWLDEIGPSDAGSIDGPGSLS